MPRMLVAYDPAWPSLFEALADGIRSAGDPDWIVEHIGSTAVPELRANAVAAAARGTASYNAAKTPLIQELVDAARHARGLPSVPVSDKRQAERE
ncbi:GrpB family protein [Microbacterium sp. LWO14-1.2]|uniref:GrpB family protein n=1 Tax=Microbacterium sp. LWO14-1.2 TaxID=3135263 RepID=UPI0031398AEB